VKSRESHSIYRYINSNPTGKKLAVKGVMSIIHNVIHGEKLLSNVGYHNSRRTQEDTRFAAGERWLI